MSPRRILIIKPSALGDIVHALPVLNSLKRRWPDAKISWLVGSAFAGLLENHPQLDRVIPFDRHRFAQAWWNPKALAELLGFVWRLRRDRFDLVIDLQGLFRSGLTARLARSYRRIGFKSARELAWIFYNDRVDVPADQHASDRYLQVAHYLGCPSSPLEFLFPVADADRAAVASMIPPCEHFAVLLPGTNWATKRWPIESFAALVEPLKSRYGLTSVVAGGNSDAPLADQINGAINLTGRTSLPQLVALLERADLVIANDSGPMHVAAALGRPLVAMYGPTNPTRTGPWRRELSILRVDIPCSPCYSRRCSHQSCLKWLTPEAVLQLAGEQLRAGPIQG